VGFVVGPEPRSSLKRKINHRGHRGTAEGAEINRPPEEGGRLSGAENTQARLALRKP